MVRQPLLANQGDIDHIKLLRDLIAVPASSNPTAYLEVTLLGINLNHQTQAAPQPAPKVAEAVVEVETPVVAKKASKSKLTDEQLKEGWPTILGEVKKQYNTLYGILRIAKPRLEDDKLILAFEFPFHQKRISDSKNQQIIGDLLYEQFGQPIKVECVLEKSAKQPAAKATPGVTAPLDNISNIFGGAEVLES